MFRIALMLACAFIFTACSSPDDGRFATMSSGVQYLDHTTGTGDEAVRGATLTMHYTGWLYENGKRGKQFDSSRGGNPFSFRLGAGEVIEGWDEGIPGMKVGGKRELVISPEKGYGSRGFPGSIPPNSTLNFEVELLQVAK